MKKKRWPVFLSLSLLVGATSSFAFKKKKKQSRSHIKELENFYLGKWHFVTPPTNMRHCLEIREKLTIYMDDSFFDGELIELSREKMIIRDKYGYHVIISSNESGPHTLYDEATDQTYTLKYTI